MPFLLDTSVLIDAARKHPGVRRWFAAHDPATMFTSAITVGELYRGAHSRYSRDPGLLLRALREVSEDVLGPLRGRILGFDEPAAVIWGRLMGDGEAAGRRPALDDSKIAAIVLSRGMTLATSNTRDFAPLCPTVDPRAP